MPNETSDKKLVTTESEISSNGVGHSKMQAAGGTSVSSADLTAALKAQQLTIEKLAKENEALKAKSQDNSVDKLAEALGKLVSNQKPIDQEHIINKSSDFSQRTLLDGEGMMAAQQSLMDFQNESKIPISIPKTFQSQFGPSLAVSVNGIRVSIPCDGVTYFINETHALAAKERMAKVDRLLSDTEPKFIETNA